MSLEDWFRANKRSFPWRENPTPYRVWISEVMLQQTRASVVIPYFERWMTLFPTVADLAAAPIEHVIKVWEGLGYYSRARNLHAASKIIVQTHEGNLPSSKEKLSALPGLGPYTVGAILSFGFKQKACAIDGNVARVISRFAWIDVEISKLTSKRKVEAVVNDLLHESVPWVTMEALIELGATICTPQPLCNLCPLQKTCAAHARGLPTALPIKVIPPKIQKIARGVAVIEAVGQVLLRKNAEDTLMGDLWEFPYFEDAVTFQQIEQSVKKLLSRKPLLFKHIGVFEHSFTRYSARLFTYQIRYSNPVPVDGYVWIPISRLGQLPFSSGHRKIVKRLYNESMTASMA